MGYLDNSSITVDAILTKKGRELLAKGRQNFNITQFALADDEVDYDLWNPAHPLGSDYYGVVIESMPITEAVPDETQSMKYKLITLPKGTTAIPFITVGSTAITVNATDASSDVANISPETRYKGGNNINEASLNSVLGYTATLLDGTYLTLRVASGGEIAGLSSAPQNSMAGDAETANSVSVVGKTFRVEPNSQSRLIATAKTTKVIITANETGGRIVVDVTVTPPTQTAP
jgi:hypothetical protein